MLGAVLQNNPQNAMMVAMALYLVKIGVLLVLLLVLQDATFFAPKVFAGGHCRLHPGLDVHGGVRSSPAPRSSTWIRPRRRRAPTVVTEPHQ